MSDALVALAVGLVGLAALRVHAIERRLRLVTRGMAPEGRRVVRRHLRPALYLPWRRVRYPSDPSALTTAVVVPPLGDGRPGEWFLAPADRHGEAHRTLGPDGTRQDASIPLAPGSQVAVVCLGRVGATRPGPVAVETTAAAGRPGRTHAGVQAVLHGPVYRVDTALGEGYRTWFELAGGMRVVDTHVDRDGWAFVVGVTSRRDHEGALRVYDAMLATWRWLPAATAAQRG